MYASDDERKLFSKRTGSRYEVSVLALEGGLLLVQSKCLWIGEK